MGFTPGGGTGSGGGGGGSGGSATLPILSVDPGSPALGDGWVKTTAYVDPTDVYNADPWIGGGINFSIPTYAAGDAVNLLGPEFAIASVIKFFLNVDDGASTAQASIAVNGAPGLVCGYDPGTTTLALLISSINAFSMAHIGKNFATLGGGFTGAELVGTYTFGGSIELTFATDHTPEAGLLKVQGSGLVYSFPATILL